MLSHVHCLKQALHRVVSVRRAFARIRNGSSARRLLASSTGERAGVWSGLVRHGAGCHRTIFFHQELARSGDRQGAFPLQSQSRWMALTSNSPASKQTEAFLVTNMHCGSCVSRVEQEAGRIEGVTHASAYLTAGKLVLDVDPARSPPRGQLREQVVSALKRLGYDASPLEDEEQHIIQLQVDGIHCVSCVGKIEGAVSQIGATKCQANAITGRVSIHYTGTRDPEEFIRAIEPLGFKARLQTQRVQSRAGEVPLAVRNHQLHLADVRRRLTVALTASFPVFALHIGHDLGLSSLTSLSIQAVCSTAVLVYAAAPILRSAFTMAKAKAASMDTLVSLGVGAAYIGSIVPFIAYAGAVPASQPVFFEAVCMITSVILAGRFMEARAKGRVAEGITTLMRLQPSTAHRLDRHGASEDVSIDEVDAGDTLLVKPGERIPVDGVVVRGSTQVDESTITGEAVPVTKKELDRVIGGTVCVGGSTLHVQAERVGADTLLSAIAREVESSQASKTPIQRIADRIAGHFVPFVLTVAGGAIAVQLGYLGADWITAAQSAITVLVSACPCALGLATPTAIQVATAYAASNLGVLLRSPEVIEVAKDLTTMVFDKTGTLTVGRPSIDRIHCAESAHLPEDEIIQLGASLSAQSSHPYDQAISNLAHDRRLDQLSCPDFKFEAGFGLRGTVNGHDVLVGSRSQAEAYDIDIPNDIHAFADDSIRNGGTTIFVSVSGKAVLVFSLRDQVRADARRVIQQLQADGVKCVLASGDTDIAVQHIAEELGITEHHGGLKPHDKLALVKRLQAKGHRVGMVGDGVNDSLALAQADVSFGVGHTFGTDLAIQTSDVVFLHGDIGKVRQTLRLSAQTLRIIKQNIGLAFGYNSLVLPLAVLGYLNPVTGASLMAMESVSVVTNSLRLRSGAGAVSSARK